MYINTNELKTVANYAASQKPPVSVQNIYGLIKRKKLKGIIIDGVHFVRIKPKNPKKA